MPIAELDLLPAVRKAELGILIVAGGTSCRHQIADGTGRNAGQAGMIGHFQPCPRCATDGDPGTSQRDYPLYLR